MIQLIPIEIGALRDYVKKAFQDDHELLTQYHISPGTLEHCVDHTMGFIIENISHYKEDMTIFAVVLVDKVIGYTITIKNNNSPNELYSFGINVKYRTKEILKSWLHEIRFMIGTFYVVLWSKNTRAIDFFEKNGCVVDRERKMLDEATKTLIVSRSAAMI